VIAALPVLALHMNTLAADSDSARLVAAILFVREFGTDYLVDTQEVLLPHLVFGPLIGFGGIAALKLVCVLAVQALTGVTTYISWRLTGSALAALASGLSLLVFPGIVERALLLPMYGVMLAAGAMGVFLMWEAARQSDRRALWVRALLAAVCFLIGVEAQQVGQVFLVLSVLLIVTVPVGSFLRAAVPTYLIFGVLMVPRLLINLSEGGTEGILSNRIDFWITKDYLTPIQVKFWFLPVELPLAEYVGRLPQGLVNIVGWTGFGVLFVVIFGALVSKGRGRAFAALCFAFVLATALQRRLPFYSRYFSHLLVGAALASGACMAILSRRGESYRRFAIGLIGLLAVLAAVTLVGGSLQAHQTESAVRSSEYGAMAAHVPPDASVIGTRATYLLFLRDDIIPYGEMFLSEREYATFLTWPDDEDVLDIMRRRRIRYVMIPHKPARWVARYNNIWLQPAYGRRAIYHRQVRESPNFCLVVEDLTAALFRRLDVPRAATAPRCAEA
jgi:hypothetical protein